MRAKAILKQRGIEDFIIDDTSTGDNRGVRQTVSFDNNSEDPAVIIADCRHETV
ncbi:hypothetical protein [uncultured Nostoc sp.]|uniref:hypothetical protein n=1 Tax=uncultured Nostoc sp. TaxID=340711 RepID=UPI0035CC0C2D